MRGSGRRRAFGVEGVSGCRDLDVPVRSGLSVRGLGFTYRPVGCRPPLRRLGRYLDALEGPEHVPPIAALAKEATKGAPDLGEDIVAQVE